MKTSITSTTVLLKLRKQLLINYSFKSSSFVALWVKQNETLLIAPINKYTLANLNRVNIFINVNKINP